MVATNQLHIIAVTGFIKKDGKFLILKRSDKEVFRPGKWTVPGGKVDGNDSMLSTLAKEIREETGLKTTGKFEFMGDGEVTRPDGYHVLLPKFLAEVEDGEVKIDEEDFTDYAWVGKEDLEKFDLIDGVRKDLEELLK